MVCDEHMCQLSNDKCSSVNHENESDNWNKQPLSSDSCDDNVTTALDTQEQTTDCDSVTKVFYVKLVYVLHVWKIFSFLTNFCSYMYNKIFGVHRYTACLYVQRLSLQNGQNSKHLNVNILYTKRTTFSYTMHGFSKF